MDTSKLSLIFKAEYSNLVAVLCNFYGLTDIQLAEDVVSEAFVKAMKSWSHKGVPENPKAWLRKVSQNILNDHYRRKQNFSENIAPNYKKQIARFSTFEITEEIIEDSQLNMIFVICDPKLNHSAQISLALRILCGFNIDEIAKALLSSKDNINKKLYRAKKTIKSQNEFKTQLTKEQYQERIETVLRVIYLIFNEGYYSCVNEKNIRHEMCWEAMRLTLFLTKQDIFKKSKITALLALMCFHASRFEARLAGLNGDLLLNEQDKTKWNYELIKKGEEYLKKSADGNQVSKYHIEAAIAYWHTTEHQNKWANILQLYNRLLIIEYSPIIAMNRTYALAMANSVEEALVEAKKLKLNNNHYYYSLMAELHQLNNNIDEEIKNLNKALKLATKKFEQELIKQKLNIAFNG